MLRCLFVLNFLLLFCINCFADAFNVVPFFESVNNTGKLSVIVEIPENHYLYANMFTVIFSEVETIIPEKVPELISKFDQTLNATVDIYAQTFTASFLLPNFVFPIKGKIEYQGCNDYTCFMPEELPFNFSGTGSNNLTENFIDSKFSTNINNLQNLLSEFKIVKTAVGYIPSGEFLNWLSDNVQTTETKSLPKNFLWSLLLIFIGGIMLNLTPCILPMIPIMLGIFGSGSRAENKLIGFTRGIAFGSGIAIAYGILGIITITTGSQFGTLNSTWWFNLCIFIILLILALATCDVIKIDFSKQQHRASGRFLGKHNLSAIFMLGVIFALMAGACVAPIIIQALLLSSDLYNNGQSFAILIPFVLGSGMALIWPIVGAGFTVLPKPGAWMKYVKYIFTLVILIFAFSYAMVAWNLYHYKNTDSAEFEKVLQEAKATKRQVLIDFWATWCSNCKKMDATVFNETKVSEYISNNFLFIKYQAEFPNQEPHQSILKQLGVKGLPTYIILEAK